MNFFTKLWETFRKEPVRAMNIVKVLVTALVAFNVPISNEQAAVITALAGAIFMTTGEITRSQVMPMSKVNQQQVLAESKEEVKQEIKQEVKQEIKDEKLESKKLS